MRHGTDIINPGTSRCNIMLLADNTNAIDCLHHFLYAQVLGAYHANVIYTGPGMYNYEAHCFDFLWVQWYKVIDPKSSGWDNLRLDSVHFLPMNREDAFGFVDPNDVLRRCHIMPIFAEGKRQVNGISISCC